MISNKPLIDFFEDYCKRVDITKEQLFSKSRKRDLVEKRMVLSYTLRKSLGMTYQQIGKSLDKNHASIIHSIKNIENFLAVYPHIRELYSISDEVLLEHKENLIEFYNSPIRTQIEREKKLVEILLDNNSILKSKIKQLKKQLNDVKE
jgi:hypothetical protein